MRSCGRSVEPQMEPPPSAAGRGGRPPRSAHPRASSSRRRLATVSCGKSPLLLPAGRGGGWPREARRARAAPGCSRCGGSVARLRPLPQRCERGAGLRLPSAAELGLSPGTASPCLPACLGVKQRAVLGLVCTSVPVARGCVPLLSSNLWPSSSTRCI